MKIQKAVITAAGQHQRTLPLQILVDRDGTSKTALSIIVAEAVSAGIEEIAVVVCPGDQAAFSAAAGTQAVKLHFIEQTQPRGYAHAVFAAKDFVGADPVLLMVGDHVYVSREASGCARQLVDKASMNQCSVSAVQATHESKLPYFGAIGGRCVTGHPGVYHVTDVLEKPTPTVAEQRLIVPGLRNGYYLCFFGMPVLTPTVMRLLRDILSQRTEPGIPLSTALDELAKKERYLAYEVKGRRYDIGGRYGLLTAQIALGLEGQDRDDILAGLVELLASRQR